MTKGKSPASQARAGAAPSATGAPPQLDPTTGFLIVRVAKAIDRGFCAGLQKLELKPRELHVLRFLDAAAGSSHGVLAAGLGVDAGNLIETLDGLEQAGLIRREIDRHDRRRRRITLTSRGSRRLRAGLRTAERAEQDVLGSLDAAQLDALRAMMLTVYSTLEGSRAVRSDAGVWEHPRCR
jgi:DNA-binding MarR family transcriptional regulator